MLSARNLTQRQLSDLANVSERTINEWIRGVSFPRLDRAATVARVLNVSFKELCESIGIDTTEIPNDGETHDDHNATDDR
ncbi:MAG: helix-turn-helix transcriptional regulator [Leptolyngbyaceae cyanobacterium SM1_3_5]|nr:helix-turn-helix transcriptional regulator [Leptolyngbyaceae cyanobacterium SM1_3_5]